MFPQATSPVQTQRYQKVPVVEPVFAVLPDQIPTPKLSARTKGNFYRYYAGFSEQFVRAILGAASLGPDDVVLDPWNGSGTTTRLAAEFGLKAVGLDLNPVMAVLGKARLLASDEAQQAARVLASLRGSVRVVWSEDPLLTWFDRPTAALIRGVTNQLGGTAGREWSQANVESFSTTQAHLYTALFMALRGFLGPFTTSNPTWIRNRNRNEASIHIAWPDLRAKLLESSVFLQADAFSNPVASSRVKIRVGSSTNLPADVPASRLVLTSPPYCTRIDYAVATRPELAILGITSGEQDILRRQMLGTPTIQGDLKLGQLGREGARLLSRVLCHQSKASATYYAKWLVQYLDGYAASLSQVSQKVLPGGAVVVVVQDSYYKDVHIDLSAITVDTMADLGWTLVRNYDFKLPSTMARVHRGSRIYRTDFSATERVLIFTRTQRRAS